MPAVVYVIVASRASEALENGRARDPQWTPLYLLEDVHDVYSQRPGGPDTASAIIRCMIHVAGFRTPQSNPVREGLIAGGLYGLLAGILVLIGVASQDGGIPQFLRGNWGAFFGALFGRSVFIGFWITVLDLWRTKSNVTKLIFGDWRYYLLAIFPLATGALLAWFWVGVIYQYRFTKRMRKADSMRFTRPQDPAVLDS